nr:proteinaceous RNase P 2 isoform X1 [Ipomoea batatas]
MEKHSDYEVVVDGANVGLYQQNFAEGGFSISQVRYTFVKGDPELLMPPSFSGVIQVEVTALNSFEEKEEQFREQVVVVITCQGAARN